MHSQLTELTCKKAWDLFRKKESDEGLKLRVTYRKEVQLARNN